MTPANYGFTIIAKIRPGREEVVHRYGKTIEDGIAGDPTILAPLKLHYLRWILFDIGSAPFTCVQSASARGNIPIAQTSGDATHTCGVQEQGQYSASLPLLFRVAHVVATIAAAGGRFERIRHPSYGCERGYQLVD
jgi:hypothetical protein